MPRANLRVYVQERRTGPLFSRGTGWSGDVIRDVMRATATDLSRQFMEQAALDIRGAGKFGSRWTNGFTASLSEGGGNIRLDITHQVPYFNVFTKTTVINGKPLLWIPLSFASDAIGKRARDFGTPLFRVNRSGKAPLLFSWTPGVSNSAAPKYFGKQSVTIPQKFHTYEIARKVVASAGEAFAERMRNVR